MDVVKRFQKPLGYDHLEEVLGGGRWAEEPLPAKIDLNEIRAAVCSVDPDLDQSQLDMALAEPLHRALEGLTSREAADMRVWHWLCVIEFPELVWRRWGKGVPAPAELSGALTFAIETRFLGNSSLNGVSRNTLARIWWTSERLRDGNDYELARRALSNQDKFQNIFERFFGIYPPAARACLDRFEGRSEAEIRRASKWLQQCASTTVLETLDEAELAAILDEVLAAATIA